MESLFSNEPSFSPSKQIKNSNRKIQQHHHHHNHQHQVARLPNISRQSSCNTMYQKYAPPPHVQAEMVHAMTGGVFLNHYPNQFSPYSSLPPILPSFQHHHQKINHHHHHHQQPPLLPLPAVSKPAFRSLPPLTRVQSLPPLVQKKQPSKTPTKKTQKNLKKENSKKNLKKENNNNNNNNKKLVGETKPTKEDQLSKGSLVEEETEGPDTRIVPKEANRVLLMADLNINEVFRLSPPPSSLPLPKFSMSKLSCNAEAAADEVDTGATDKLCRMLKLR